MSCVEKLPHDCGSSDGLQVFEDNGAYTGYCFSCDTYISNPYKDLPIDYKPAKLQKSREEIEAELSELGSYPCLAIPSRKLREDSLNRFGCKTAVSEVDGITPTVEYFPYYKGRELVGYKARLLAEKRMWSVAYPKTMADVDLFGWQQAVEAAGLKLFITEGEYDAVSLYQALVDKQKGTAWETYLPSVVSLPHGAGSASKAILAHLNDIKSLFKEVVLVFDMDEHGDKAAKEVALLLPYATRARLPKKDANECLMAGLKNALANSVLFKTTVQKNTRLIRGTDLHEAARVPAAWGLSWPWAKMTKFTRGIRFGETYYIGAGVKMGKSEVVNAIGSHLITEHNLKILMAKPEEANNKTYKLVAGKIVGRIFHDPEIPFDYEAFDKAKELIGDKLIVLDVWQHLGWATLREDILQAVELGCKAVFIDPITNLTNGIHSGEANTMLQSIAQDLAAMARDLDIAIFIFCHLKAPDAGPPHERGGKVQSYQFSGSRAMMRSCNYMIGLEGNKDPDQPKEQMNIRSLVILEDREFGTSGYFKLYRDDATGLFNELEENG